MVAVSTVMLLALAASCGDGDDPEPSQAAPTTEEDTSTTEDPGDEDLAEAYVDAMIDGADASDTEFVECLAEDFVDIVGAGEIDAAGVDPQEWGEIESLQAADIEVTDEQVDDIRAVMDDCIDDDVFEEIASSYPEFGDSVSDAELECLSDELDRDILVEYSTWAFVAGEEGDDTLEALDEFLAEMDAVAVACVDDDVPPLGDGGAFGDVSVSGTPLADSDASGGDPAVGQPAPQLSGTSYDGSAVAIPSAGTPTVVLFVAHWCPHCQNEVAQVQTLLDANGMPDGVALAAVATSTDPSSPNFPPGEWLTDEGWTVPTLLDDEDGTAGEAYAVGAFPTVVVIAADGTVVQRTTGELTPQQWGALIEAARTGQPSQ
jgi:thiol-disulfide isomerase/thioredoxin